MLHSPETTPLSEFVNLDSRSQAHVLHALQSKSVQEGDAAANIRLLFAEALQVVASLAESFQPSSSSSSSVSPAANATSASTSSKTRNANTHAHEETTSSYLNAIMLFNAAFEETERAGSDVADSMIDDYIFVRAVYIRLHRVQAAISMRIAEDVERDLRQFAKDKGTESHLRPAHFNAIMTRAFDAVPPPDDDYWAQLEHVPAAVSPTNMSTSTMGNGSNAA
ncbi:hypothetical protein P389DRAFT_165444 [Cystobasidium minutum MCA 4210]|uniref:uncharacterized protein n=1 Tax=Cystobasidium minutum MCA 4210 TaxID=1397322 RepID=UPI0034CDB059|eukprot:jgi/Rhomi1/165444/fgenesh1_kg.1_\